jgi:general secretion pathway protein J
MNRSSESGFTLIEVLVALTLFGLVLAILIGAVGFGLRGARVVEAASDRIDEVRSTQTLIRRYLETARPVVWTGGPEPKLAFEGTAEAVRFIAPMPPWGVDGGPYEVSLAQQGDRLILSRRISAGLTEGFDFSRFTENTTLLAGIRAFRVAYFGDRDGGQRAQWATSWQSASFLPQLVRIQVDFGPDGQGIWPDLMVAPMIAPRPR